MLFKIILSLSHGCFAKRKKKRKKRNLEWKGGRMGEREGCHCHKRSWLQELSLHSLGDTQPVRELKEWPWLTDSHLKVWKNLGQEIRQITFLNTALHRDHDPSGPQAAGVATLSHLEVAEAVHESASPPAWLSDSSHPVRLILVGGYSPVFLKSLLKLVFESDL